MIYHVFRQLLRVTLRIFFRHIHISNVENVPYNKPLVIAANHPGAFLDPVMIACFIRKPIHFLVRGDMFKNRFVRFIFSLFNMIPVYRKDEGFENIEKNLETNAKVADVLKRNGIVVVFCEGYSSTERRLRTVLKGTARICMQTAMEANIDVQIVAAGITYTHKTNFRKEVLVDFSKPIAALDYSPVYNLHPQKSFVSITAELKKRLEQNFVVIKNKELDIITELHLMYHRNTNRLPFIPIIIRIGNELKVEQSICDKIDDLFDHNKAKFETFANKTYSYENALAQYKCNDESIVAQKPGWIDSILLLLGIPVFCVGFVIWGIPYLISKLIADKTVYRIDFHDSVTVNITNVLFTFFALANVIVLFQYLDFFALAIAFLIPLVCIFSAWYFDTMMRYYYVLKTYSRRRELLLLRENVLTGLAN